MQSKHRKIAEKALGHPLPKGAEVHHHNRNRKDNRKRNLVICENQAYHKLLHARMTALELFGWDPQTNTFGERWTFGRRKPDPKALLLAPAYAPIPKVIL